MGPGLIGGILGLLVLGGIGQGLGWLYVEMFKGPYCCGLEAIIPPLICTVAGAGVGAASGAGIGIAAAHPDKSLPRIRVLLGLWVASIIIAFVLGRFMGFEIEGEPGLLIFVVLTIVAPFALWNATDRALEGRSDDTDLPL